MIILFREQVRRKSGCFDDDFHFQNACEADYLILKGNLPVLHLYASLQTKLRENRRKSRGKGQDGKTLCFMDGLRRLWTEGEDRTGQRKEGNRSRHEKFAAEMA